MKKTIILLVALGLNLGLFAQKAISSKIESVTVFRQNAEITRTHTVKLIAGQQELVFTGISTYIDPASLQVLLSGNAILLSAKYERNYMLEQKDSPKVTTLKEALESITDELAWLRDQKAILVGMEDILNKNKDLGGNKAGFTPAQVIELTNSYKTKLFEIRKEQIKIKKEEKEKQKENTKLQSQLNELNAAFNKPSGNIVLLLEASKPVNISFKCKYIVSNAGWTPLYDLRSEGITENVQLNYKANIYQSTGQDWDKVKMIVSTGNPSTNNDRPILNPLYANFLSSMTVGTARGIARDKKQLYTQNIYADEEIVTAGVAYKDGYAYSAQVGENQMSIEYGIQHRQSIAGDGKENLVALETYELDTEYVYHAVPKLDKGAFLLAKISNWSQFNLLSGNTNIFFEGAYVGQSFINAGVTSSKLLLSLGRDESIVVERKAIKDYSSSKFLGANKKEQFGFELRLKNKKSVPITIEVLDQIPVSKNKKIEVELEEKGTAIYTEEIGKLLWKFELNAGQTKKERFVYSVKYPKKENISGVK